MDCGDGLLLLMREHIDPLRLGGLLEILSTEISVKEDLPAWCRLTGNQLVSVTQTGRAHSFLVCKGTLAERRSDPSAVAQSARGRTHGLVPVQPLHRLPVAAPAPAIAPLTMMGIGSWPRPRWMLQAESLKTISPPS
jgi:5-methyltetrahydropteroyltriglutamate--homocysteine methyltransferase